jgi:uncharacterized repeat protein (TIGR02543 family)
MMAAAASMAVAQGLIPLDPRDIPREPREVNLYTVTFGLNGGAGDIPLQIVAAGEKAIKPEDPTLEGYYFVGWFDDFLVGGSPQEWDFDNYIVNRDTRLHAGWSASAYATVTFDLNGGAGEIEPQELAFGEKAARPQDPEPPDGYRFAGWFTECDFAGPPPCTMLWDFERKKVYGDRTLTARWESATSVSSAVRAAGGRAVPKVSARGRTLAVKSAPGAAARIRLFDMRGRAVSEFYSKGGGASFSLAGLPPGNYLAEVRENGKRAAVSPLAVR